MDDDVLFEETVAQRTGMVDVLNELSEDEWDRPSLCEGWRVREVVAHITMPYRHSSRTILTALVRARGKFDVVADRLARRDAAEGSSSQLLGLLRDNVKHRWTPPGGGQLGALSHDVIHGLDITEALGLAPVSPPERVMYVLNSPQLTRAFKVDLTGYDLSATDTRYRHGEGDPVRLPSKDLLLICTGRRPLASEASE